jgi:hypothetical protein
MESRQFTLRAAYDTCLPTSSQARGRVRTVGIQVGCPRHAELRYLFRHCVHIYRVRRLQRRYSWLYSCCCLRVYSMASLLALICASDLCFCSRNCGKRASTKARKVDFENYVDFVDFVDLADLVQSMNAFGCVRLSISHPQLQPCLRTPSLLISSSTMEPPFPLSV